MSILTRARIHDMVRWPLIGTQPTGEPIWGPPEDVKCRWDESVRQLIRPDNTRFVSRIEIISAVPLTPGDLVKQGTTAEITNWVDPRNNDGAYEVIVAERYSNFRGTEVLYSAYA